MTLSEVGGGVTMKSLWAIMARLWANQGAMSFQIGLVGGIVGGGSSWIVWIVLVIEKG